MGPSTGGPSATRPRECEAPAVLFSPPLPVQLPLGCGRAVRRCSRPSPNDDAHDDDDDDDDEQPICLIFVFFQMNQYGHTCVY